MNIRDSVVFVTGANRGIGLAFVQELLVAGARKVYAAARNPENITLKGVQPVRLDVTKPETIAAAAIECTNVNLLINNAGIALWTGLPQLRSGSRCCGKELSSHKPAIPKVMRDDSSGARRCEDLIVAGSV